MEAMSTKAMDTRRQMGGVNAGKESSLAVNKQVKQLENRLEKVRNVSQIWIALLRTMRGMLLANAQSRLGAFLHCWLPVVDESCAPL